MFPPVKSFYLSPCFNMLLVTVLWLPVHLRILNIYFSVVDIADSSEENYATGSQKVQSKSRVASVPKRYNIHKKSPKENPKTPSRVVSVHQGCSGDSSPSSPVAANLQKPLWTRTQVRACWTMWFLLEWEWKGNAVILLKSGAAGMASCLGLSALSRHDFHPPHWLFAECLSPDVALSFFFTPKR